MIWIHETSLVQMKRWIDSLPIEKRLLGQQLWKYLTSTALRTLIPIFALTFLLWNRHGFGPSMAYAVIGGTLGFHFTMRRYIWNEKIHDNLPKSKLLQMITMCEESHQKLKTSSFLPLIVTAMTFFIANAKFPLLHSIVFFAILISSLSYILCIIVYTLCLITIITLCDGHEKKTKTSRQKTVKIFQQTSAG